MPSHRNIISLSLSLSPHTACSMPIFYQRFWSTSVRQPYLSSPLLSLNLVIYLLRTQPCIAMPSLVHAMHLLILVPSIWLMTTIITLLLDSHLVLITSWVAFLLVWHCAQDVVEVVSTSDNTLRYVSHDVCASYMLHI